MQQSRVLPLQRATCSGIPLRSRGDIGIHVAAREEKLHHHIVTSGCRHLHRRPAAGVPYVRVNIGSVQKEPRDCRFTSIRRIM